MVDSQHGRSSPRCVAVEDGRESLRVVPAGAWVGTRRWEMLGRGGWAGEWRSGDRRPRQSSKPCIHRYYRYHRYRYGAGWLLGGWVWLASKRCNFSSVCGSCAFVSGLKQRIYSPVVIIKSSTPILHHHFSLFQTSKSTTFLHVLSNCSREL